MSLNNLFSLTDPLLLANIYIVVEALRVAGRHLQSNSLSKVLEGDPKLVVRKWKDISTALRSPKGLGLHQWQQFVQGHISLIMLSLQRKAWNR